MCSYCMHILGIHHWEVGQWLAERENVLHTICTIHLASSMVNYESSKILMLCLFKIPVFIYLYIKFVP